MSVKLKVDVYTKVVLTLIAVALILNVFKGVFRPNLADALTAQDVNIVGIYGKVLPQLQDGVLPIETAEK